MKDVFKGVAIKILSIIVIIAILGGVAYGGYRYMKTKAEANKGHETVNNIEVIKEKLVSTAELNTYSYLCTDVITRADSKTFKDWKIPFTEKSFIVQYDGTVKAGISDLTKAQVTEEGEKIVVKLPEVEITSAEIDNDSFEKLDESNNIFNPITVEDLNDAQKDLKEKMIAQAINKGILDEAKANAETIIAGMLNGTTDNDIVIDWQ